MKDQPNASLYSKELQLLHCHCKEMIGITLMVLFMLCTIIIFLLEFADNAPVLAETVINFLYFLLIFSVTCWITQMGTLFNLILLCYQSFTKKVHLHQSTFSTAQISKFTLLETVALEKEGSFICIYVRNIFLRKVILKIER